MLDRATPIAVRPGASPITVGLVEGVDLTGLAVEADVASGPGRTLLLFVSAGCHGCIDLFAAARSREGLGLRDGDAIILVVKEPAAGLSELVGDVPTVVSPTAWKHYQVTGPPFFTWIDPACSTVATEGVAWGPGSIASAIADFHAGSPNLEVARLEPPKDA